MIGKSLRSYRIEAKLGAGGMVWSTRRSIPDWDERGHQDSLLRRSHSEQERRFVQEAKAASSLNHPNIVTIYDIDTQQVDGQPVSYIAMSMCGRNARSPDRKKGAADSDVEICHPDRGRAGCRTRAGIVHRDLKRRT